MDTAKSIRARAAEIKQAAIAHRVVEQLPGVRKIFAVGPSDSRELAEVPGFILKRQYPRFSLAHVLLYSA